MITSRYPGRRRAAGWPVPARPQRAARRVARQHGTSTTSTTSTTLLSLQAAGGQPGPQQVVPVRFAAEQHAQLRAWCAEHGFSMATVVRGLVARFLEGQLPARN